MGYVCAFRGRRDSYQVPLALSKAGLLDLFITDHYCGLPERLLSGMIPQRLAESVRGRFEEGLPPDRVLRLRLIAVAEAAAGIVGVPAAYVYDRFDPHYGTIAAREARRLKSDLLMYSSYAHEAFSARYSHTPRKVLFQYHPHHVLEDAILASDRAECERAGLVFSGGLENLAARHNGLRQRGDAAWRSADRILCASSFTKTSLVEAGADPARIAVVPYGVSLPPRQMEGDAVGGATGGLHALFVGSGLQRKGLHHLLLAWVRARLPAGSELTVVARVVDPGLIRLLQTTPRTIHRAGVTEEELRRLYATATVFVMPSLVEGFGQVYLEALAHGLPVIGTAHTCLPDIGGEADGVFLTEPGRVGELAALLERLSVHLDNNIALRQAAVACARRFTWEKFRKAICTCL